MFAKNIKPGDLLFNVDCGILYGTEVPNAKKQKEISKKKSVKFEDNKKTKEEDKISCSSILNSFINNSIQLF